MRSAVGQNFPVGFGHRAGLGSQYHHQGIPKAGSWGLGGWTGCGRLWETLVAGWVDTLEGA